MIVCTNCEPALYAFCTICKTQLTTLSIIVCKNVPMASGIEAKNSMKELNASGIVTVKKFTTAPAKLAIVLSRLTKKSTMPWIAAPMNSPAAENAWQMPSQIAITALRNSSLVFQRVVITAIAPTTAAIAIPTGLAIAANTPPSIGRTVITVPASDSNGPIAATIPRITAIAVCPPLPSDANHCAKPFTTGASDLAMFTNGSPKGSNAAISSRNALVACAPRLWLIVSAISLAAPSTSPKVSETFASDSIIPIALSSPSDDHVSDAICAAWY